MINRASRVNCDQFDFRVWNVPPVSTASDISDISDNSDVSE